jgi:hypothetical protein
MTIIKQQISNKIDWSTINELKTLGIDEILEFEIKEQATEELRCYVDEKKCLAALIVLKVREGVIQIRTHYGLTNNDFEKAQHRLVHSIANNIIETGLDESGEQSTFGELMFILPSEAMFAYGFPVTVDNKHDRAVVFFRSTPFSKQEQRELKVMVSFLEALGEKLLLVQAWDADRAFANLGRLSSAVMHELRNNVGLLKNPIKNLKSMINSPKNQEENLRAQIISLEQRYQILGMSNKEPKERLKNKQTIFRDKWKYRVSSML